MNNVNSKCGYIGGLHYEDLYKELLAKLDRADRYLAKGKAEKAEHLLSQLIDKKALRLAEALLLRLNSDQGSPWTATYKIEHCHCCGEPFIDYRVIKSFDFHKLPAKAFVGKLVQAQVYGSLGILKVTDYSPLPPDPRKSNPYELYATILKAGDEDEDLIGLDVTLWRSQIAAILPDLSEVN